MSSQEDIKMPRATPPSRLQAHIHPVPSPRDLGPIYFIQAIDDPRLFRNADDALFFGEAEAEKLQRKTSQRKTSIRNDHGHIWTYSPQKDRRSFELQLTHGDNPDVLQTIEVTIEMHQMTVNLGGDVKVIELNDADHTAIAELNRITYEAEWAQFFSENEALVDA